MFTHSFLQLTLPRCTTALQRVKSQIWTTAAPVDVSFAGNQAEHETFEQAAKKKFKPVKLPFTWGMGYDQGWFRLELPRERKGLYLHWMDEGEGTLYCDGTPYYGFDPAHRYCPLPTDVKEFHVEGLCMQLGIWGPDARGLSPDGSKLTAATLCRRDDLAWEVYHDLLVLHDMVIDEARAKDPSAAHPWGWKHPVDIVEPSFRQILRTIDDAIIALDEGGLLAAQRILKAGYKTLAGRAETTRAILNGHAHIDLVWLWPERATEFKLVHTFSTMNRLMDVYPEFIFGSSQPAGYDAVARRSPRLLDAVKKRIKAGSWEMVGAMEVEADTLIACGEALARNFVVGQRGFTKLQGKPSNILWIPDVFGYCASLPQIMRETGVDYFFTTKLTWSNVNRFPFSSFRWRGHDGSEVLVHVTQGTGYNQSVSPLELRSEMRAYRQSDVHNEFIAPTGYGDGGGGTTEEMCERARRVRSLATLPEAKWGRVDTYFKGLDKLRDDLPIYQGELYLEYHRAVSTTHGHLKAAFRAAERGMQAWEAVRCARAGGEVDEQMWKRLVFSHFHDCITATSIWEVYEEIVPELNGIASLALDTAVKELDDKKGKPCLFNPLPVERLVVDGDRACLVPPLSGVSLDECVTVTAKQKVTATKTSIASERVKATFTPTGEIASLEFDGHPIAIASPLAAFVTYADRPHAFEPWDIDLQTLSTASSLTTPAKVTITQHSDTDAEVAFTRACGKGSTITTRYRLNAWSPVLDVTFDIDWHEDHVLLKAHFPTAYSGRAARFAAPFGSVLRGQQRGLPNDEAMFEAAASRWAIVSDDGENDGLGVVTESKYGFSCQDGDLTISLLRSPYVSGQEATLGGLTNEIRRGGKREDLCDQGKHRIRIALCRHGHDVPRMFLASALVDSLYTPCIPYLGTPCDAGLLAIESGSSLVPCWAKPAADGNGWILRLHETLGQRSIAKLTLAKGLAATATNIGETAKKGKRMETFEYKPYQVISIRIAKN